MRLAHPVLALMATVALAACGGAEPPPPAAAAPAAPAAAAPAAAPAAPAAPAAAAPAAPGAQVAFSTMTKEQRLNHMKTVIRPTMAKVFQDFDAKDFGNFGCTTCHGEKHGDTHDALPKLKLSDGGFQKLSAEKPAVMKFMAEKVTPAMAVAMGEKPFDPATHQGFGCGGCHAVQ